MGKLQTPDSELQPSSLIHSEMSSEILDLQALSLNLALSLARFLCEDQIPH